MRKGRLLWEFGIEYAATAPSALRAPTSAFRLANDGTVVADIERNEAVLLTAGLRAEQRAIAAPALRWAAPLDGERLVLACGRVILVVDLAGRLVAQLTIPLHADFVGPGRGEHLVVVDSAAGCVAEINHTGSVTWSTPQWLKLRQPRSAVLHQDNYVIVDDAANWVVLFSPREDRIVWTFGDRGRSGRDPSLLFSPKYATPSSAGILIADSYNNRVLEVGPGRDILWVHGVPGEPASTERRLWRPTCAVETTDGTILIADSKNDRVIEVDREGSERACYGEAAIRRSVLRLPRSVEMCRDGTLLVANTHGNEVVWLEPGGRAVRKWPEECGALYWPRSALPSRNGVLICDGRNDRVVELTREHSDAITLQNWIDSSTAGVEIVDPHSLAQTDDGWLLTSTGNDRVYQLRSDRRACQAVFGDIALRDPHFAMMTRDGALVVADTGNSRLVIQSAGGRVHTIDAFALGDQLLRLRGPRFVRELLDGRWLVVDMDERALICGDRSGRLWWYLKSRDDIDPEGRPFYFDGHSILYDPRWACEIGDRRLLLSDTGNNRILALEIDPSVWYGTGGRS